MHTETVVSGPSVESRVTWAWLDPPTLDFGVSDPDEVDGERVVWLHADPHRALGVRPSADRSEAQRAYRRAARLHHPDLNPGDPAALERFYDVRHAFEAVVGEPEVTIEPISGDWWSFTGFVSPAPGEQALSAVAGLGFEIHDLHLVPRRDAGDDVRVSYAGQTLALRVGYSESGHALPLWRARIGVVAELSILVLLCLALVPIMALLLAADLYLLSDTNEVLAWAGALLIVGVGYGALAAILASGGRRVPFPRRAVGRTRAVVTQLGALASRTRPG